MTQRIPLEGRKLHRLTVYEYAEGKYRCVCECGKEVRVLPASLLHKTRPTKSCGCYRQEITGAKRRTHAKSKTRTYKAWASMKARCYVPSATGYKDYGGRGVVVCDRWRYSFDNFYEDMGECPPLHGVDRIDVDGDYTPENCRWQHKNEQAKNQRKTVRVEGRTLEEWSVDLGVPKNALYQRWRKHGSLLLPNNWNPAKRKYE